MTTLHITHNNGSGDRTLCGAAKNQTYRTLAEGTSDRYIDRFFVGPQHLADPAICQLCLAADAALPSPTMPAIFNLGRKA